MNPKVSVRQCPTYDLADLRSVLNALLDDLGGPGSFVKRGERVLLKPNLLRSAKPEEAVVTHPHFVEAVAGLVKDLGAEPFVGDSPPLGSLKRVLSKSGYDPFMTRMGVKAVPFVEKTTREFPQNRVFKRIDLAREIFEFDKVINLPKLKTHTQMGLTLAVKNLFGAIIGADKASWHMRAGRDFDTFATALIQIYEEIAPELSLLDGILAMEGFGPNSGSPRYLGLIAASQNGPSLDTVISALVGFPIENLRTSVLADQWGIGSADLSKIDVVGDRLEGFPLQDFKPPKTMNVTWNMSRLNPVRRFMENHMVTKPDIDLDLCRACGICMEHCPPGAISRGKKGMRIDRRKCISCFCCHELCAHDAVLIVEPFWGRVFSKFR